MITAEVVPFVVHEGKRAVAVEPDPKTGEERVVTLEGPHPQVVAWPGERLEFFFGSIKISMSYGEFAKIVSDVDQLKEQQKKNESAMVVSELRQRLEQVTSERDSLQSQLDEENSIAVPEEVTSSGRHHTETAAEAFAADASLRSQ